MRRLIFIAGIIIFFSFQGNAQSSVDFKTVDSLTYKFYEAQNWDSLIYFANNAIKNDVDYFYLRMRIGIAFYEKQKYRKAVFHFKKAVSFNSTDDLAMEYLYYSYLFSGMKAEASSLTAKFSDKLKEKLKLDKFKVVDEINFEGGPTLGSNIVDTTKNLKPNMNNFLLKEDEMTNNVTYFSLGLKHSITKNISIFHSVSSIDIGKTQNILVYNGLVANDYHIYQRQYYISANFYLGNEFSFKPAFHYINVNYDKLIYDFDNNKKLFLKQETFNENDFAASATLSKNTSAFNLSLNGVYAQLNNSKQKQANITATVFPKSNLNFYINSSVTVRKDDSIRTVVEALIGGKVAKSLWVDGFITFGLLYNYVEKNAYVVYNINDAILNRRGISLNYVLNKNIGISLHYQNIVKRNTSNIITPNNTNVIRSRNNFINHSIIGGIKWTL